MAAGLSAPAFTRKGTCMDSAEQSPLKPVRSDGFQPLCHIGFQTNEVRKHLRRAERGSGQAERGMRVEGEKAGRGRGKPRCVGGDCCRDRLRNVSRDILPTSSLFNMQSWEMCARPAATQSWAPWMLKLTDSEPMSFAGPEAMSGCPRGDRGRWVGGEGGREGKHSLGSCADGR